MPAGTLKSIQRWVLECHSKKPRRGVQFLKSGPNLLHCSRKDTAYYIRQGQGPVRLSAGWSTSQDERSMAPFLDFCGFPLFRHGVENKPFTGRFPPEFWWCPSPCPFCALCTGHIMVNGDLPGVVSLGCFQRFSVSPRRTFRKCDTGGRRKLPTGNTEAHNCSLRAPSSIAVW